MIGGVDPYEIPRNEYLDDMDLWPAITHIHVGMYLLFSPSQYSGEDLPNFIRVWIATLILFLVGTFCL